MSPSANARHIARRDGHKALACAALALSSACVLVSAIVFAETAGFLVKLLGFAAVVATLISASGGLIFAARWYEALTIGQSIATLESAGAPGSARMTPAQKADAETLAHTRELMRERARKALLHAAASVPFIAASALILWTFGMKAEITAFIAFLPATYTIAGMCFYAKAYLGARRISRRVAERLSAA